MIRSSVGAPVVLVAALVLSGCAATGGVNPAGASGDATPAIEDESLAGWVSALDGVLSARAAVRPGASTVDVYVEVDPDLDDEAIVELTEAATTRVPSSIDDDGNPEAVFWYHVGEGRDFSSRGGSATRDFFLGWRPARNCPVISTRGRGPATADQLEIVCPDSEHPWLSNFLLGHQTAVDSTSELAEQDPDLHYVTRSVDGIYVAESTLSSALTQSIAYAMRLDGPDGIEVSTASAFNDGSGEHLTLGVASEADKRVAEERLTERPRLDVELTVDVVG